MPRKKSSSIDKLVKGIIIGGAIGSVVGITLAPKSGKETRAQVSTAAKSLVSKTAHRGSSLPRKATRLLSGVRTFIFGKKRRP